ncbi:hypothetical protein NLJ89_g1598 [Agrocybe chaxingu]|uniref:Uncharacterized protein n=1 Tax=Agrocybe chaxingu TaxID=84603 RepID=A0A9W8TD70_9AGAR|nr:hypothetical protein NLJ89_g1598 [Agrocybe chaxingu]
MSVYLKIAMFTSSVMLMFGIWDAKTLNPNSEKSADMENVRKALRVLKAAEDRWQQAGRFWDILSVLSSKDPRPFSGRSQSSAAMSSESLEMRKSPLPHIQTRWSQVPGKNSERSQPIVASVGEDSSLDPFHSQDYWDFVSDGYHLDNFYLPHEPEGEIDFHPTGATYSTTQPLPEMAAASWMPQQLEPVSFRMLSPTLNPSPSNNGCYATQNDTSEFMQLQSNISAVIATGNQHCVQSRGVAQRGWVKKVYSDGDSLWSNISPEYGVDNVLDNNPEVA